MSLEWRCDIQESITGKSAPSPPAAPDPAATAAAQSTANVDTAAAQAALNNVNQVTPFGNLNYNVSGNYTTPSGQTVPTYTQTTTLNPQEQQILNQQIGISGGLAGLGGQVLNNISTAPLNTSGLSPIPNASQFSGDANNLAQSTFGSEYGLLQPILQRQQEQTNASLASQGLNVGSEAYNNAQTNLAANQGAQLNSLAQGAVGQGYGLENQLFNQAITGNQANLAQQQTIQDQPINMLAALLQGSPAIGQPNFPGTSQTGISPTDVIGATGISSNAAQQTYANQAAQASAGNNAAAGAVGTVAAGIIAF